MSSVHDLAVLVFVFLLLWGVFFAHSTGFYFMLYAKTEIVDGMARFIFPPQTRYKFIVLSGLAALLFMWLMSA